MQARPLQHTVGAAAGPSPGAAGARTRPPGALFPSAFFIAVMLVLSLMSAAASAADRSPLAAPEGSVMLEIRGAIATGNGPADAPPVAQFDRAMLDSLPQRETVTSTPWHEGPQSFGGPTIAALLQAVGAEGSRLRVVAVNDYSAEIPVADVTALPVILASRQNGQPMSLRDKGPLFVIYPFDEVPGLLNETTLSRSVWQVRVIEVLP